MQPSPAPQTHNLLSESLRRVERREAHRRSMISPLLLLCAAFFALVLSFVANGHAFAQLRNFQTPPLRFPDVESNEQEAGVLPESVPGPRKIIVDFDPGVDDAAALIWLLSQDRYDAKVKALVVSAGNVTPEQGFANAQMLLNWLEIKPDKIPVIMGGTPPPTRPLSLAQWFIHGPGGLWFVSAPPVAPQPSAATEFYCNNLKPGMMVIALAPLTSIAEAMVKCPGSWNGVEIVDVGGSRFHSSQTPVTEYNHWQNPEAAAQVLELGPANGATIQLVLADAFSQLKFDQSDLRQIERRGNSAIKNLLPALQMYVDSFGATGEAAALADVAGVIYALDNRLGSPQLALVHPLAGEDVQEDVRGQTIIGFTLNDHVTMLSTSEELNQIAMDAFSDPNYDLNAAIGAILAREQDNADVVTDIDARRMHHIFLQGIRTRDLSAMNADEGEASEMEDFENQLFVPLVSD